MFERKQKQELKTYSIYASCYHSFEVEARDEEEAEDIAHDEMYKHYTVYEVTDIHECEEV